MVPTPTNGSLKTARTTVRRLPERGRYERDEIYNVLDAGFICHVGFCADGQPYVVPTSYWRKGDTVYFHGSSASRMLRNLSAEIPMCLTATHVDGLVLARSGFHHSVNYRSVMILGNAALVADNDEKYNALKDFVDYVLPGRWPEIRWPNEQEMKATSVLRLPISEASVKVRTGDPKDDPEDLDMDVWAGVVPLHTVAGQPVPSKDLKHGVPLPDYAKAYKGRAVNGKPRMG
ncbi:MAG: pyridoxamine 5'-phosphate oxidase family protein [Acidobacteria bacterium]|nr:pyridoxamine 5'-phosphate oxidase family protein [Acidobacteriota bacterium]